MLHSQLQRVSLHAQQLAIVQMEVLIRIYIIHISWNNILQQARYITCVKSMMSIVIIIIIVLLL